MSPPFARPGGPRQSRQGPERPRFRWKVRLVVYGGLLAGIAAFAIYCTAMPGRSAEAATLGPTDRARAARLRDVVTLLARGPQHRNLEHPEYLRRIEDYLEGALADCSGRRVVREVFSTPDGNASNLVVEFPSDRSPRTWVVVGAHYDAAPNTPGANDNATGVAATLELVRHVTERSWRDEPRHGIRFVLFANEEPPYFRSQWMGSRLHAEESRARDHDILAMLSLETLGYYSTEPDSQDYPFPIGLLYPSTGNFVAFVGRLGDRQLVRNVVGTFRDGARIPSEGGVFPSFVPGIGWSDHWAFWQQGYPALMVTDTAPFRDPHYHQPTDTPERLDYDRLALVVEGLTHVIGDLAFDPSQSR